MERKFISLHRFANWLTVLIWSALSLIHTNEKTRRAPKQCIARSISIMHLLRPRIRRRMWRKGNRWRDGPLINYLAGGMPAALGRPTFLFARVAHCFISKFISKFISSFPSFRFVAEYRGVYISFSFNSSGSDRCKYSSGIFETRVLLRARAINNYINNVLYIKNNRM